METSTRRGLLGAIAIAPVAAILASSSPALSSPLPLASDGGRWWRIHARMQRIDAAHDRYSDEAWRPRHDAFLQATGGIWFRDTPERKAAADAVGLPAVEDRCERMVDVICALRDQLVELPAPDAKALDWKLAYLVGDDENGDSTPCWSKDHIAPIVADLRRFLGVEG